MRIYCLYCKLKERFPFFVQIFWILMVIFATILITVPLIIFKSQTTKIEPKTKPKLVRTLIAERTDERVVITAFGTVQANREVSVRAEVSGRVMFQSKDLVVGGLVEKGNILLSLDARDYKNTVEQEKAAVERAKFELEVEQGRQVVAKREWEQLQGSLKTAEISEDLALRKPHLREKEAALEAALSRLKKAQIDLSRTTLRSPMNAIVISENVEQGDYVTPQTEIARLAATDEFRVQVSIPVSKLKWINIPQEDNGTRSPVQVIQDLGGMSIVRKGRIMRLLGNLDPSGRMARLLVAIEDPLGLKNEGKSDFPLLIGSYIRVEIEGPLLEDVIVLPREALHEDNKVWVKNRNKQLDIRKVSIVQKHEDVVFIDEGIEEGEEIVISNLPLPVPGMTLRTLKNNNSPGKAEK